MRSALLSAVSHDLRTPLASITGSAQVLLDRSGRRATDEDPERRELLEAIRDEGDRLNRLVTNLLDVTRLEAGSITLEREWCPVDEVVDSALGRFGERLDGRALTRELPSDVLLAWIDAMLVEQAMINLIDNALKYSAAGTPIDVAVRADGGEVVFEVRDRGRGIPAGEERRIFERFYRCAREGTEGERIEGAGLGLAVVRAVAQAHGGRVEAETRPGGGARIALRIPSPPPPSVAALETQDAAAQQAAPSSSPALSASAPTEPRAPGAAR